MAEHPEPVFETNKQGDRELVTCMIGDHKGAARVFTAGVDDAKQRALTQALDKWKRAQA